MTTTTRNTTAYSALDYLVREWLPYWLDAGALTAQADAFRDLCPITDDATVRSARSSACDIFQALASLAPSGPGPDVSELLDYGDYKQRASGVSVDADRLLHSVFGAARIGANLWARGTFLGRHGARSER